MKKNKAKAQKEVVRNVQLLTFRPNGMSYKDYKESRKAQNKWLKQRLQGFICYVASELVIIDKNGVQRLFNPKTDSQLRTFVRKNPTPFVGSTRYDLKPL
jgi:hypothetical protein|nr:MAG TPA: hypothetical protein [Caudoviricetes sp.]